jgi:Mg/Co/Ni transporter MgtE
MMWWHDFWRAVLIGVWLGCILFGLCFLAWIGYILLVKP